MMAAARRVLHAIDLYEVLQLPRTCPNEHVKRAYRRLSRQIHPDKNKSPSAEGAFKRLGEAHSTLGDAFKRQVYDLKLRIAAAPAEPPAAPVAAAVHRRLVLVPLTAGGAGDGRQWVSMRQDVSGHLILGRSTRFGVFDRRVSRAHIHLRVNPLEVPTVTAIGQLPVLVISREGNEKLLKKERSAPLVCGDQIHMVVSELRKPTTTGAFAGNSCAYRIDSIECDE